MKIKSLSELSEGAVLQSWMSNRLFKANQNIIICTTGATGCLTGDSMIQVSRGKLSRRYSIKRLYNQHHGNPDGIIQKGKEFNLSIKPFVRSYNGKEIRLNKMKDVTYSGKKQVYSLELEEGKSIKATACHKFLTRRGWIPLGELKDDDEIMCDTLNPQKNGRKKVKLRDIELSCGYHLYPIRRKGRGGRFSNSCIVHRLIYEANLNGMTLVEFLDILLNEPDTCKKLKYIPKGFHVHHRDGNHYNNSIENLELIMDKDHLKYHSNPSNFSQGIPTFLKIKKIKQLGIEDTYDIECESPNHNFVANGIIVHNSGKSYQDLRRVEIHYNKHFKEKFDNLNERIMKNVCFSIGEFADRVTSKDLKRGEILLLEEMGVNLGSLDFQNKISKLFNHVLQSFRSKNIGLLMNLPIFTMMNKSARLLTHVHITMIGINQREKLSSCKCKYLQLNQESGKVYPKHFRILLDGVSVPVKKFDYELPSKELRDMYEKKKDEFVMAQANKLKDEIDEQENGKKIPISTRMRAINHFWHNEKIYSTQVMCEKIGEFEKRNVLAPVISRETTKMDKIKPNWRDNPKEIGFLTQLAPKAQPST